MRGAGGRFRAARIGVYPFDGHSALGFRHASKPYSRFYFFVAEKQTLAVRAFGDDACDLHPALAAGSPASARLIKGRSAAGHELAQRFAFARLRIGAGDYANVFLLVLLQHAPPPPDHQCRGRLSRYRKRQRRCALKDEFSVSLRLSSPRCPHVYTLPWDFWRRRP